MTYQETDNNEAKTANTEEFATMLDESIQNLNTHQVKGDRVVGKISGITESHILISLGVKQDAVAEIGDYMEDGVFNYKVGDDIKGFIVRMSDDQITVAKGLNRSHGNKVLIKEAHEKQIPIKGKVLGVVNKGFAVEVFGVRAFCPFVHIDLFSTDDHTKYVNNTYDFEIIELTKNSAILSRKTLLAKEASEKEEKFFATYKVGDIVKGIVLRVAKFGAFLDLGGYEGLLHDIELS
ncbi:MAG: S1 RNA-binding domain-containing protein, partial [Candidatus Cloacimonetes bacterium]|nr:S1 RNA-binding domain-containing protein [Candidatus Cloacimonadota bacterium]